VYPGESGPGQLCDHWSETGHVTGEDSQIADAVPFAERLDLLDDGGQAAHQEVGRSQHLVLRWVGLQRRVARDRLGVEAGVLPGGHLLPLEQPRLVADYLLQTTRGD
jgi:hypothetical protein